MGTNGAEEEGSSTPVGQPAVWECIGQHHGVQSTVSGLAGHRGAQKSHECSNL